MLSFCIYFLIRHPDIMRKAQAEVDDVLDDQQIQLEDLSKLPYLTGTYRLFPRYALKSPLLELYPHSHNSRDAAFGSQHSVQTGSRN